MDRNDYARTAKNGYIIGTWRKKHLGRRFRRWETERNWSVNYPKMVVNRPKNGDLTDNDIEYSHVYIHKYI